MANNKKIIKYHRPVSFNIGFVVFFIIIVYVCFNIFRYFTTNTIAEYEVQQGTIVDNDIYRGLILREERVVTAPKSGYINYYVKNGSKVGVRDVIYSIDTEGSLFGEINEAREKDSNLSQDVKARVSSRIDGFMNSYNANRFREISTFYDDLSSELKQTLNAIVLQQLDTAVTSAESANTFYRVKSDDTGVVLFYTDGYEGLTFKEFTPEHMNQNGYVKTVLDENTQIEAQTPVYKLVESEDWHIIIGVSDDTAKQLSEGTSLQIRFVKDGYTTNAAYTIMKAQGQYYLDLSLRTAMIRYAMDRFVDVELVMREKSGLKIPKTAITSKEFFTVPVSYFMKGGDSQELGLLVKEETDGTATTRFVTPTIYYSTEEFCYIDDEDISANDVIYRPDSTETYIVGSRTDALEGVYNINKGYAVFKQINIIYENAEYAIVEPKTAYGIALYDHIALDGSKLKEDDLIKK